MLTSPNGVRRQARSDGNPPRPDRSPLGARVGIWLEMDTRNSATQVGGDQVWSGAVLGVPAGNEAASPGSQFVDEVSIQHGLRRVNGLR